MTKSDVVKTLEYEVSISLAYAEVKHFEGDRMGELFWMCRVRSYRHAIDLVKSMGVEDEKTN